jgi:hypothetical protein
MRNCGFAGLWVCRDKEVRIYLRALFATVCGGPVHELTDSAHNAFQWFVRETTVEVRGEYIILHTCVRVWSGSIALL